MKKDKVGLNNFGARGWALTIYAFLAMFFTTSTQQLFNATGTYYTDLGWDNLLLQSLLTISGVIGVVAVAIVGQITLKRSVRTVAIVLGIVWTIGCILLGLQTNLILFAVVLIITRCVGDALAFSTSGVLVANWFPKKRGLVMGWATFGFPLAAGIGTLIMTIGMGIGGIVGAMIPFAVMSVVALLILIFTLRDYPEQCGCYPDNDKNAVRENEIQLDDGPNEWTAKKVLSNGTFWLITLSMGCMMFAAGFMTQVGSALMSIGISMDLMVPIMMAISIVACIGSYFCGVMDVKLGTKKAVVITDVILLAMGLLAQINSVVTMFIAFACLGVVLGGGSNYLVSLVSQVWGRKNFKHVFRFAIPICNIFSALAAVIIAAVAQASSFRMAFLLAAALAVISGIMILCVKKSYVDEPKA